MPVKKFKIIRDTREKVGKGWNFRSTDYCAGQIKTALPTGDYSIEGLEDIFCIERKGSISEVAKNFTEKRFWNEAARMQDYKYKFIIFEFNVDKVLDFPLGSGIPKYAVRKSKITSNFLLSKLCDLEIKYGISCIFAGDASQAQRIALNIIKRVFYDSQ